MKLRGYLKTLFFERQELDINFNSVKIIFFGLIIHPYFNIDVYPF